jgi:Sulfotransferase family
VSQVQTRADGRHAAEGVAVRLTVLYIAGSGRTGSTLLDRILGQLDGFFSVGELCNLWHRGLVARRKCGCGKPVDRCPKWVAVLDRAFGAQRSSADPERLASVARRRLHARNLPSLLWPQRQVEDEYTAALARLYEAIRTETGCRVIVDSSKSPIYAEVLASLPGVDVYTVHLVRDARAAAYSFRRKRELPDFGDQRLMLRQHPVTTARRWLKWQALTELLASRRAGRYLRLRYEDFMRQPQATLRHVANLVGQDPELPFVDFHTVHLGTTHSVSGNPNRFITGDVTLRIDDEWVTNMRARDALLVTAVTWPLLLRYRYPLWRRPGMLEEWRVRW